jgi:hypothetical protein
MLLFELLARWPPYGEAASSVGCDACGARISLLWKARRQTMTSPTPYIRGMPSLYLRNPKGIVMIFDYYQKGRQE